MTRELIFINSFEPQLVAASTWNNIVDNQGGATNTFALSNFPGFEILPGETRYTAFDSFGFPTNGEQAFVLRVIFAHSQLDVSAMRTTHSDYISFIEAFIFGGYIPPPVSTGDLARIDSAQIDKIDPPIINKTATRTTITVHASYSFTIF